MFGGFGQLAGEPQDFVAVLATVTQEIQLTTHERTMMRGMLRRSGMTDYVDIPADTEV
jgi:hypothetical protein